MNLRLCAARGCRLTGRHLPTCDGDPCRGCLPRATDDVVCEACAYRAGDQLHDIADMADAARDVAHGLSSRQNGSGGSGKPGSRLPLDLAATARLDAVTAELTTWARHVAETRGVPLP